MQSTRRRAFPRAIVSAAILGAVGLAACDQDKLLTSPTPDVVLPEDITSRAALPSAYAAALGDFQLAYGGGFGGGPPLLDQNEGLAQITALLSDELLNAETYTSRIEIDRRATTTINTTALQIFQVAQRARATADLVAGRYREFDPDNPQRAEVQALAAFMYVMFAEDYCNGVPTSRVLDDGSFEYGAPQSGTQLLTTAVAKFDSAITDRDGRRHERRERPQPRAHRQGTRAARSRQLRRRRDRGGRGAVGLQVRHPAQRDDGSTEQCDVPPTTTSRAGSRSPTRKASTACPS